MKRIGKILLPLVVWGLVWQMGAMAVGKELLLPGPGLVLRRLWELAWTGVLWAPAPATLLRVFGGLLAGVVLGTVLAGATFAVPVLDWVFSPAVKVVRATPVASFILLLWFWAPAQRVPGLISGLMVLPVIWGNVCKGLGETDGQLLELARAYGFGWWKRLRLVYAPSALPYFASGCRTALGLAWKAGVAAEVLCMPKNAVGTQILFAKNYLNAPSLFAWTLVVIGLSFLLEWGLGAGLRRLEG